MRAVVFDMDGVLFDTEVVCMKSWTAIAARRGLPMMEEVFPKCIGLNANDSRQVVLEAYGEDFDYPVFRQETAEWFRNYIEENGLPIKPGVHRLLDWLKENGYQIGLASSTRGESVFSHLKQAGIGGFFETVVTGDMVEHSKPRPDIYLRACRELGVAPGDSGGRGDAGLKLSDPEESHGSAGVSAAGKGEGISRSFPWKIVPASTESF